MPSKLPSEQLERFERKCDMLEKEVQTIVLIHTKEASVITDQQAATIGLESGGVSDAVLKAEVLRVQQEYEKQVEELKRRLKEKESAPSMVGMQMLPPPGPPTGAPAPPGAMMPPPPNNLPPMPRPPAPPGSMPPPPPPGAGPCLDATYATNATDASYWRSTATATLRYAAPTDWCSNASASKTSRQLDATATASICWYAHLHQPQ